MEIIDNFLPEDQFNIIYKTMFEEYDFEWFFTDGQNYPNEPDKFMFNHVFVAIKEGINSHHFEMLDPVLKKLGAYRIFRVKANLTVRTNEHEPSGFHVDGFDNSLTSIYYINTCNGWTEFETGGKVESVANRMLIFDSNLVHAGFSCTDQKTRILINFNYE